MDNFYTSSELAQSVPIHHYEKWIDQNYKNEMSIFIQKNIDKGNANLEQFSIFIKKLQQFTVVLSKEATSLIMDIAIQQHSTTSFSLAKYTLRNCLIYTLTKHLPSIQKSLEEEVSEWEINHIWTVSLPELAATLQMLYDNEKYLPCILYLKNVKELYSEIFELTEQGI